MKKLLALIFALSSFALVSCEDPAEDLFDQKMESFAGDGDQDNTSGDGDQDNTSGDGDQDNTSGDGDQDNLS